MRIFVENDNFGLYGKHAGDGYALLLSARKARGRTRAVSVHSYGFKRPVYAAAYFFALHAEIFGSERDVVFYNRCDHLVVGVLENYARALADFRGVLALGSVQPEHRNFAEVGQQKPVYKARQRRFAAAVMTDYGEEFTLLHRKRNVIQRGHGLFVVRKSYAVEFNGATAFRGGCFFCGKFVFRRIFFRGLRPVCNFFHF